jgi:hypothetical protein
MVQPLRRIGFAGFQAHYSTVHLLAEGTAASHATRSSEFKSAPGIFQPFLGSEQQSSGQSSTHRPMVADPPPLSAATLATLIPDNQNE